jgi:endonuclease/exonuclease/phosphatase family metal-dependent hydrolase
MGSFASDLNISVSSTDAATRNFQFHNVLGYLKFTIGEDTGDVTELVVSSIGREKLSGKFTVDCSSETPELVADQYANTAAAISSETPLAPGDYYIAIFPGTYAKGLKFIVKGPKGVATKALEKELTLGRGKVNTLGTINVTNWTKSAERKAELSTMSFNIRSQYLDNEADGAHTLWENRRDPLCNMLMDLSPDIIGMQEVMNSSGFPQLSDVNSKVSSVYSHHVFEPSDFLEIVGEAKKPSMTNVLMWKTSMFDMVEKGLQFFTGDGNYGEVPSSEAWGYCTDNSRRSFQWVKLTHKLSGKTVWVFNTHFPVNNTNYTDNNPTGNNSKAREVCMTKMVEKAYDLCGDEAVVYFTGDFNSAYSRADAFVLDVATSWLYDARTETEDRDNWNSGNSWKNLTLNGAASVDHIFYRNVTPVQYRTVISDKYGLEFLSDHFAINFRSTLKWDVPVTTVFDAYFAEGFDVSNLEAELGEGFGTEDDYGNGNMEGFGPEDSFEFN